jgi:hypothetical protein
VQDQCIYAHRVQFLEWQRGPSDGCQPTEERRWLRCNLRVVAFCPVLGKDGRPIPFSAVYFLLIPELLTPFLVAVCFRVNRQSRAMDITQERITHETGNEDAWICICGNTPGTDGFYPCDREGTEIEPAAGWNDLYVCARCGRIINQTSLDVVGRITKSQSTL